MKEIRIEVTEIHEYPLYSFFMKDADSTRDEYEYLGCVGSSTFESYEEWYGFETIVRFLLDRLSGTCVELPCNNATYSVNETSDYWNDEWDSYCIDRIRHSFGSEGIIEVETGDTSDWQNSTLEDFTKSLGKILNLKFEVIR